MRGRRPKPTRLKVLIGNPGKRPLNSNEPHPEVALPDCPPELGPVARQEWERMTAQLAPLRAVIRGLESEVGHMSVLPISLHDSRSLRAA